MLKAPLVLILSFVTFVALGMPEVAFAVSVLVATVEAARFAYAGLRRPSFAPQRISR